MNNIPKKHYVVFHCFRNSITACVDWSQIHHLPASAFLVWGLQARSTIPSFYNVHFRKVRESWLLSKREGERQDSGGYSVDLNG